MQSTGSLIVDGVVQIVVAHVGHNTIDADRVPELMKNVGQSLIECVKDAATAFPGEVAAPVLVPRAVSAPAPRLPAPAKAATAPAPAKAIAAPAPAAPAENNVVDISKAASTSTKKAAASKAATPKEAAAPKAAAPAAAKEVVKAETAKSAPPAAPAKPKAPAYRFAHLSKTPAVPISESIKAEGIVCLFDGSPRKMLHRYIKSKYGMTPEEYRTHWGLAKDYPMTAPGYSDEKRSIAVAQGLGTTKATRNTKKRAQAAAKTRQRQSA